MIFLLDTIVKFHQMLSLIALTQLEKHFAILSISNIYNIRFAKKLVYVRFALILHLAYLNLTLNFNNKILLVREKITQLF